MQLLHVSSKLSAHSSQQHCLCFICRHRHERVCHKAPTQAPVDSAEQSQSMSPSEVPNVTADPAVEMSVNAENYKRIASSAPAVKVLDDTGKVITTFCCAICAKLINVSIRKCDGFFNIFSPEKLEFFRMMTLLMFTSFMQKQSWLQYNFVAAFFFARIS